MAKKRKVGRPRKPVDEARNADVQMRVTRDEKRRLNAAAKAAGITVTRLLVDAAIGPDVVPR